MSGPVSMHDPADGRMLCIFPSTRAAASWLYARHPVARRSGKLERFIDFYHGTLYTVGGYRWRRVPLLKAGA